MRGTTVELSKLDLGPYPDAGAARAMLRLGILDPTLAQHAGHLRQRGEVAIHLALGQSGVDDLTDYELTSLAEIVGALVQPEHGQVIAGWIRRAWLAGHLAAVTRAGPVQPDSEG